ncbi:MAG TPA: heparan-alpha-glucosaminide N-acetyltransferase domain-containing protein [Xanthobacteraceae bacterium]|nr:heparan-alpha-glucosaminide N-acetyltransferase domain-containing protein [Xanthobacteraceae bacterium]
MSQTYAYARLSPFAPGRAGFVDPIVAGGARPRLDSIDLLRGLVLMVMALDHTRDFFGASAMNPRDVAEPALFMTRWITHFCAPIFVMLAGISAWLYGARGRTTGELSRFLLTRGLWLVVIEFTVVRLGWMFAFGLDYFIMQVIFAIGASMMVLAALVHLPRWAIATIGIGMIAGHNLLDGIRAEDFGALGWVWNVLHVPALLSAGEGVRVFALYPLIPWVGVMAAGYALGPLFKAERTARVQWLVLLGCIVTGGFALLRATNLYGDPQPWVAHENALATLLSFINTEKYPPSLLYLMMTLGPGLLLLAAFETARGRIADTVITFGRVPFAYYIAHIYLIHALAIGYAWSIGTDVSWLFGEFPPVKPEGYGLGLAGIYAVWLVVLVALYPLCRWFAALKQRRKDWWLSYL